MASKYRVQSINPPIHRNTQGALSHRGPLPSAGPKRLFDRVETPLPILPTRKQETRGEPSNNSASGNRALGRALLSTPAMRDPRTRPTTYTHTHTPPPPPLTPNNSDKRRHFPLPSTSLLPKNDSFTSSVLPRKESSPPFTLAQKKKKKLKYLR